MKVILDLQPYTKRHATHQHKRRMVIMMKSYFKQQLAPLGLLCTLSMPTHAEVIPFSVDTWEFNNNAAVTIGEYQGKSDVLSISNGIAAVKDLEFTNGVIEYDVYNGSTGTEYAGPIWHVKDLQNFEVIHTRNNRNNSPYAVHYYPFNNNLGNIQFYYGQGHNATTNLPVGQWVHVKLVISGSQGELFIGDMSQPVLFIDNLVGGFGSGQVGLFGNYNVKEEVHFANYDVQPAAEPPTLIGTPSEFQADPSIIRTWGVSEPFNKAEELEGYTLIPKNWQTHTFTPFSADRDGKTNLARFQAMPQGKKTVFARAYLSSTKEQIKKFSFGFTGEVNLYLNSKLIYSANDKFGTRDHAFIGTSGYLDHIYLPLVPGNNEIWAVVSSSFVGFGVMGKFEDMTDITIYDTPVFFRSYCTGNYNLTTEEMQLPCVDIGDGQVYDVTLGKNAEGDYQLVPSKSVGRIK